MDSDVPVGRSCFYWVLAQMRRHGADRAASLLTPTVKRERERNYRKVVLDRCPYRITEHLALCLPLVLLWRGLPAAGCSVKHERAGRRMLSHWLSFYEVGASQW